MGAVVTSKRLTQSEINVLVLRRLWFAVEAGLVAAYPPAIMFYIGSGKGTDSVIPLTLDDLKLYFKTNVLGSHPDQLDSWYDNQGREILERIRVNAIILDGFEYRSPIMFYLPDLIDLFDAHKDDIPDYARNKLYRRCQGLKNAVAAWRIKLA